MGRHKAPCIEDIRYTNPITGVASSQSRYTDEQGIKKKNRPEYKINGEWVKPGEAPHNRENQKKSMSSKNGFFCGKLGKINEREKGIK